MSGFSIGCSEWRIIERSLSLCLISERCNEVFCCHYLGMEEEYPLGGEKNEQESEKEKRRRMKKQRKMSVHS